MWVEDSVSDSVSDSVMLMKDCFIGIFDKRQYTCLMFLFVEFYCVSFSFIV